MFDPEATNPTTAPTTDDGVADAEETLGLDAEPELETANPEEGEEVVDDTEEVDHEGKKYRVPKDIKPALMLHADYTKKTQEVAEQRRALEAQQQQFQQARELQQQNLREYAQLSSIDSQLEQFSKLNWQQLSAEDPFQAQQLWMQQAQLKEARQSLAGNLSQREQQALESQRAEAAKRVKEGQDMLTREIKNWSPEYAKTLAGYGETMGYTQQELATVQDARAIKLLHKAYLYDQLAAKASKPPPASIPNAKPSAQLPSGKSTLKKDPTQMSDAEFDAYRRKVISKR